MCYSGRCRYEQYFGDCSLNPNDPIPDDALCSQVPDKDENIASEYLFGIDFRQDRDNDSPLDIGDNG